ncbi:hypothetical protein DDI_2434 [Dickeya dianthicola RNS04.9]|nr:hypothetical protein DDI_2434 [Dickeya dianthicola RNS04.9]
MIAVEFQEFCFCLSLLDQNVAVSHRKFFILVHKYDNGVNFAP